MPLIAKNQLDKIVHFFKILEQNNVRYIVLRGYNDLPERIRTDLDIACHYDDQYIFYQLAKKHLSCDSYPYISQINGKEIVYWDFCVIDDNNEKQKIRMDLYNGIYWFHGKQYYPDGDEFSKYIFNNRDKNDWFYIPSVEIDLLFNILRCVYDKNTALENAKVGLKYRNIIETNLPKCNDKKLIEGLKMIFPRLAQIAPHLMNQTLELIKKKDYVNVTKMFRRLRTH